MNAHTLIAPGAENGGRLVVKLDAQSWLRNRKTAASRRMTDDA